MYFFLSLLPATLGVIVGYFILFSSTKSQGAVRTFGQVLAVWVFVFAAVTPIAGAYATYAGVPSIGAAMESMHSGGNP
jgi:hypothetical protein